MALTPALRNSSARAKKGSRHFARASVEGVESALQGDLNGKAC